MIQPSQFHPSTSQGFIGPAHRLARLLEGKAGNLAGAPAKLLLYGPPGTGKTQLANMFGGLLAGHKTQIESVNGRRVTPELVRRWMDSAPYLPLFGSYTVKIVNELDTCSAAVQDLLLSYLDDLPGHNAFIGTSNMTLSALAERFQTRLQQFRVEGPNTAELTALVVSFGIDAQRSAQIAVGSGGNVRAALLDAQSVIDAQILNKCCTLQRSV